MATRPVNKQSFRVSKVISKSFSILLDGFTFVTTFILRMKIKNPIAFISSAITKPTIAIRLRRVRLAIIVKLTAKITQTFNLKKVRVSIIVREIKKFVLPMSQKLPIAFISKAIEKTTTAINLRKIALLMVATVASFFTLATFDPQNLSAVDTLTLGDMDYTT